MLAASDARRLRSIAAARSPGFDAGVIVTSGVRAISRPKSARNHLDRDSPNGLFAPEERVFRLLSTNRDAFLAANPGRKELLNPDLPRLAGPGATLVIHDIGAAASGWWLVVGQFELLL